MDSLKSRIKSPSFWLTILGGIGTFAAGLTDTGNPTLMAIGTALIAVHAIGEFMLDGLKVVLPVTSAASNIGDKAAALVPIVEHQVANVQTLIHTVSDQAKILNYRMKGYEVTPHVDVPVSAPNTSSTATVGGEHQIIGVPK